MATTILHEDPPFDRVVDATTRGIDDLDVVAWVGFTGAACLARTALQHPFMLAYTRRQASPKLAGMSSWELLAAMRRENGGSWRTIYRGFGALAMGNVTCEVAFLVGYEWLRNPRGSSPLISIAPEVAVSGSNEAASAPTDTTTPTPTTTTTAVEPSPHFMDASSGFVADAVTTVGHVPFILVANRQICAGIGASRGATYQGAWATLVGATKASPLGWRGMFTGLSAGLLLSLHSAPWWAGYEDLKARMYPALRPSLESIAASYPQLPEPLVSTADNVPINTVAAATAAGIVAALWNPALVLQTRMQVASETSVPRLRDVASSIWRADGARGFTRGTCMFVVASVVDAVGFSVLYEVGKQYAQRH